MSNAFAGSLETVDSSGRIVIVAILVLLVASIACTWTIRRRYRALERELGEHDGSVRPFDAQLLNVVVSDVRAAWQRGVDQINVQAIVEHRLQSEMRALLIGERFVKASVSLAIILGLVGTFYGLTSAIGKLINLVSADSPGVADVTLAVTQGLSQTLTGMSVAFSTSLFGIMAAIVLTLVGVFFNVPDRRTRTMVVIEAFLDNALHSDGGAELSGARGDVERADNLALRSTIEGFAKSVDALDGVVAQFDSALQRFASNTRDFQEFNLHLKDNIQRMSLTFGDLSDTIKSQVNANRPRP